MWVYSGWFTSDGPAPTREHSRVPDRAIEVPGVGCIVDGVPPRMQLTEEDIQIQLDRRRPGQKGAGSISTGRNEDDAVQILSGAHPAPPWARARAQLGNLSAAGE